MRVCQHEPGPDGSCLHCGSWPALIANPNYTCVWRDLPDPRAADTRPEPSLRPVACEDSNAIYLRLAELKIERDNALNRPAEEA